MTEFTSEPVGKSVPRIDIYEKVTGSATFADDMQFGPGLYHGRLVRSPYAHALIRRVDVTKALQIPGVKAVVTGADVQNNIGLYLIDRPIFARERVRYVGEPVAGVVAITEEIAHEAAQLVEVEYNQHSQRAVCQGKTPVARCDDGVLSHVSFPCRVQPLRQVPSCDVHSRFRCRTRPGF